jgi:hypothetical protein
MTTERSGPESMQEAAECEMRNYETARSHAYREFCEELNVNGKMSPMKASAHCSAKDALANIDKPRPEPLPEPPSWFERALFNLYKNILTAYKQYLVNAAVRPSKAVRLLAERANATYHEIDIARLEEFAQQRAGFYGQTALPEIVLYLIPENARGHTSRLLKAWRMRFWLLEHRQRERLAEPRRRPRARTRHRAQRTELWLAKSPRSGGGGRQRCPSLSRNKHSRSTGQLQGPKFCIKPVIRLLSKKEYVFDSETPSTKASI